MTTTNDDADPFAAAPDWELEVFGWGDDDDAAAPAPPRGRQNTAASVAAVAKQFLRTLQLDTRPLKPTMYKIIASAADITLPPLGHTLKIRTQTQLNMISLVLTALTQHETIDELVITTYTLNLDIFTLLTEMVKNGQVKSLTLLLSSSYGFRLPENKRHFAEAAAALNHAGHDVHLVFAWLHFKITLMRCGRNFYNIEGSMNYSTNNMAEQLSIDNDQQAYEFDRQFIGEITSRTSNSALEVIC